MGRPADETSGEAHGEFALIARHFTRPPRDRSVRVGVGDDAAVVAHAQDGVGARPGEMAGDQLEFGSHLASPRRGQPRSAPAGCFGLFAGGRGRFCAACTSAARSRAAALSSTPLTNLWPSVPP